jgi:hypothetical protein
MEYNLTSIKRIIGALNLGFSGNNWINDALVEVPNAIAIIGTSVPLVPVSKSVTIAEHKGSIPCDLESLLFITYYDNWLPIKKNGALLDRYKCESCPEDSNNFGILTPNTIQTSFKEGTVVFHYYSIPLDSEGMPMILDNVRYVEAIQWWVIYKLMLQGYQHRSIKDWREAYQMWQSLYPQAQNDILTPNPDEMQRIINSMNTLVRSDNIIANFIHK